MAIDNQGYTFAGARVYGVLPLELTNAEFIAGLLNSSSIDFYLKHISTVFVGSGSYAYDDQFIKQLPIKLPLTADEQRQADAITALAETLTTIKSMLRAKERERADFPGPQTQALPPSYNFYRLEQLVQASLLPKTFRRADIDFGQLTLDGKPTARIGRGRLELPHQAMADVVVAWLRVQRQQTVQSADLLDIRVPANEHGCRLVLQALAQLDAEITTLSAQFSTDETRLDDLVAAYYGLDADDRAVIDEFLSRF